MFLLCIMIPTIVYLLNVLFIVDLYMRKKIYRYILEKITITFEKKTKTTSLEVQGDAHVSALAVFSAGLTEVSVLSSRLPLV